MGGVSKPRREVVLAPRSLLDGRSCRTGDSGPWIFASSSRPLGRSGSTMKRSSISTPPRFKRSRIPNAKCAPPPLNGERRQSGVCVSGAICSARQPQFSMTLSLILMAIKIPIRKHVQMRRAGTGLGKYAPATLLTLAATILTRTENHCQRPAGRRRRNRTAAIIGAMLDK